MNKKFDYFLLTFENSLHTGKKREFPGKNNIFPVFPEVQNVREIANPTSQFLHGRILADFLNDFC